jgi:hypothetical protein
MEKLRSVHRNIRNLLLADVLIEVCIFRLQQRRRGASYSHLLGNRGQL